MNCEVCEIDPSTIQECNQPKNGYCALYLKQAKKDAAKFDPKKYKLLVELEVGDTFRYKGSADDDWHTVIKVDKEKIYYPGYVSDCPNSNYRVENVEVILK